MLHTRIYESVFIVNATLEDTHIEAIIEKMKEFLTKNGAEMRAVEKWGRRRLAYPIKKKNNGFYVLFEFKASGDLVAKLERQYQLEEQIIRYLTIQLDKKALKVKEVGQRVPGAEAPQPPAEEPKQATGKEGQYWNENVILHIVATAEIASRIHEISRSRKKGRAGLPKREPSISIIRMKNCSGNSSMNRERSSPSGSLEPVRNTNVN